MTSNQCGVLFSDIDLRSFVYHTVHGHPEFAVLQLTYGENAISAVSLRIHIFELLLYFCRNISYATIRKHGICPTFITV